MKDTFHKMYRSYEKALQLELFGGLFIVLVSIFAVMVKAWYFGLLVGLTFLLWATTSYGFAKAYSALYFLREVYEKTYPDKRFPYVKEVGKKLKFANRWLIVHRVVGIFGFFVMMAELAVSDVAPIALLVWLVSLLSYWLVMFLVERKVFDNLLVATLRIEWSLK